MYRLFRVVALLLLVCSFGCGAEEPARAELVLDGTVQTTLEVPFPIAVLTGRAGGAETLTLRVGASGETCTVPLRPGTAMAFRFEDEAEPSAVRLEGLDVETPSAGELVDRLRERLREAVPEASVRRFADTDVFVVDLPAGLEGRWAGVLDAVAPPSSVHFLIEVLPAQLYPFKWAEGETPPRLEKGPLPWAGTADEFRAFREEEVKRWVAARASGEPYEPSRDDLLVLPRGDTDAADVDDFAVVEWTANPEHRFDGRMLANPTQGKDPNTGKPMVFYDIRAAWQERFEAWTGANVGLPLAIVVDWVYRTAPTINSPLRDNVQITLGTGSWAELQREAKLLTRSLGGAEHTASADLVAVCTWQADGALELFLPLEEGSGDTLVSLETQEDASVEQQRVTTTLHRALELDASPRDAVDARLAEVLLGLLDAEGAAPLLGQDRAGAVDRLLEIARGDAASARRVEAVRLLGLVDLTSYAASGALAALVEDDSEEVAAAAAQALDPMARHDDQAFDALVRGALSGRAAVQEAARSSLMMRALDRRQQLVELAIADDPARRVLALQILGLSPYLESELLSPPVRAVLLAGLDDPAPEVRSAALAVLMDLTWLDPAALRPHLAQIAASLEDEDLGVRSAAAACLGRFGSEAHSIVQPYLDAAEPATRAAAVMALIAVDAPSPEILERIEQATNDPSLEVRLSAAMLLAATRGDVASALPVAREGLRSKVPIERQLALGIIWMGGEGAAEVAPLLEPLLDAQDAEERIMAAATLRRIGRETERSRSLFDEARRDPEHPAHEYARHLEYALGAESAR